MRTKTRTKTLYVVAGNINGNEDDALLGKTVKDAATAICGRVIGALAEMGYTDFDGSFHKVEVMVYIRGGSDSRCVSVSNARELGLASQSLASGERIECIALRRYNSRNSFAEWKVSEVNV